MLKALGKYAAEFQTLNATEKTTDQMSMFSLSCAIIAFDECKSHRNLENGWVKSLEVPDIKKQGKKLRFRSVHFKYKVSCLQRFFLICVNFFVAPPIMSQGRFRKTGQRLHIFSLKGAY